MFNNSVIPEFIFLLEGRMKSSYDESNWDHNHLLYVSHISENSKSEKNKEVHTKERSSRTKLKTSFHKLGSERNLGYCTWSITKASPVLIKDEKESGIDKRCIPYKTSLWHKQKMCWQGKCIKHLHAQLKPLLTKLEYSVIDKDYSWSILEKWRSICP